MRLLTEDVTTARPSGNLPTFLNQKYQDFCELQFTAYENACCPEDLFEHPEADNLSEMGCTTFIIPEAMVGSPCYNPLLVTQAEREQVAETESVGNS